MGILALRGTTFVLTTHTLQSDTTCARRLLPRRATTPAMSTAAHKVVAKAKTAGRRPPSVLREIVYGMSLGLFAGYLWKLHHWSNQRRTREFYSLLNQGKITVVADEPPPPGADD